MTRRWCLLLCGMVTAGAGEMPPKASSYHEALKKRPESVTLFERFREAWLEEISAEELEKELLSRAEAGEAGAWAVLGRARLAAAKEEGALEAFGKAREAGPGAWLNMEIGRLKLAAKDFEGAEQEALAVPAEDKLRPDALKLAGLACLRGGRIEEAQAHWEKAVAAAPGDKSLLEDLTELTRREGRLDLALEYCGKWRDAVGDDAYARALATLALAELLEASQRHEDAMAELGAVLKVSGDGSWLEREALARVERAFRQRGDMTARAGWLGELAAANPTRLNFHRAQAQALSEVGKTGEALEVLAAVLKRLPGDRDARWQRIALLERDLKLEQAYDECAALAAEEKSEEAGLRRAELAFRLGRKEAVKQALDEVLAAADPAKRPALAGLYARYGMPEESEKQWRAAAAGEQGGQALRELAKFLRMEKRDKEAVAAWKEIGARDSAADRMESARMLAAAGERKAARDLLESGREKYGAHPGYEEARAQLALMEDRNEEALEIYRALAVKAERLDDLSSAWRGWLSAAAGREEKLVAALGDGPGERCLRMAWLAREGKPLPEVEGELERAARLALLKENGRWAEAVAMMEARPGSGGLYFRELGEAKEAAGDALGALAAVRVWRERSPDQAGPWVKEASLLEAAGDGAAAERLLRRAVARFEDDPDAPRRLFSLLEGRGGIATALDFAWQRHDRAEEDSARAGWLREIIRVSREGDRLEELKERFEERARRDPASPGPQRALAELAKARGDSREEMEHLRKAADAAPRDVELVSALAAIEERNGQMERALQRHEALAKLVPGADSAMKLAQAKIRCGDIEGGMRDMQMLAGDEGLDLRELEKSVGALATSGHMDEAIRMLEAVDRDRYDARLHFVAGMLCEAAGRGEEALEHFLRVMAEPEDPAERPMMEERGMVAPGPLAFLFRAESVRGELPGFLRSMNVPDSLAQAKFSVAPRILDLALQADAEVWSRVGEAIPGLKMATVEQWRQALDFSKENPDRGSGTPSRFVLKYPDHPLARFMVRERGGLYGARPEELAALLEREAPLPLEIELSARLVLPRPVEETAAWLRSVPAESWRDEFVAGKAMQVIYQYTRTPGAQDELAVPRPAKEWSACLDALDGAGFTGARLAELCSLKARRSLEEGDGDGFVKWSHEAMAERDLSRPREIQGWNGLLDPLIVSRLRAMGEQAREALLDRITSPLLRCEFALALDDERLREKIARELAALPADAVEPRRDLIRLSWRLGGNEGELRKWIESDADPVLAIEALVSRYDRDEGVGTANHRRGMQLLRILKASGDDGREVAARYEGYFIPAVPGWTPTRWGTASQIQASYRQYRNPRDILRSLSGVKDRSLVLREVERILEETMLSQALGHGSPDSLFEELRNAGLFDDALAAFRLPDNAGLGRQVAAMTMFDAGGRKDRALEMAEELHGRWPGEPRWTIEVALRTEDRMRGFDLLSEAAGDREFIRALVDAVTPRNRQEEDLLPDLKRLADWAEGPGRDAEGGWIGVLAPLIAHGSSSWLAIPQDPAGEPAHQAEKRAVFGRFLELGLARPEAAEAMFRALHVARSFLEPQALHEAARAALRSGAYATGDRPWFPLRGGSRNAAPQAPAALEHLIQLAAAEGDEVAFPPAFREALAKADPATDAWLTRLLEAGSALDLPDVRRTIAMRSDAPWTELARHEAAMLRAVRIKGRDELLVELFKEQKIGAAFHNIDLAIVASLAEAAGEGSIESRLLRFFEAAAGPREDWPELTGVAAQHLSNAAQWTMKAISRERDSVLHVGVITTLTNWKLPANHYGDLDALGSAWGSGLLKKGFAAPGELPGWKTADALKLGSWERTGSFGGKKMYRYTWWAPQAVRSLQHQLQGPSWQAFFKKVYADPRATMMDLMLVAGPAGELRKNLMKRALRDAAPELAKAPPEIREAVVLELSKGFTEEDYADLPKEVARLLRTRAEQEKTRRIEQAVVFRDSIKSSTAGQQGFAQRVGQVIGTIAGDDRQLAEEIVGKWLEAIGKKDGDVLAPADFVYFVSGLFNGRTSEVSAVFASLEIAEWLGKGQIVSSPGADPFFAVWHTFGRNAESEPAIWKGLAGLSPAMQVRLLTAASLKGFSQRTTIDGPRRKALAEAAKGSELTRLACAWYVALNPSVPGEVQGVDGKLEVAWLEAMKTAGASSAAMRALVLEALEKSRRLDDPAVLLAAVPGLLADVKTLTPDEMRSACSAIAGTGKAVPGAERRVMSYPAEAGVVLAFLLEQGGLAKVESYHRYELSKMVLALEDADLTRRWMKAAGKTLIGSLNFTLGLLKQGQPEWAVSLVPPAGRVWPGMETPFTRETEQMVASLAAFGTTDAFRLRVHLSMKWDVTGAEAPAESLAARRVRLVEEFGERKKTMSPEERMSLCASLGLAMRAAAGPVPELDEFLGEDPGAEVRSFLSVKSEVDDRRGSTLVRLGAACSAFHRGDPRGIDAFSAALEPVATKRLDGHIRNALHSSWIPLLQGTFWIHADRHDGVMPEATAKAVRTMAALVTGVDEGRLANVAWSMVLAASPDAAAFERNLREAGLPLRCPAVSPGVAFQVDFAEATQWRIGVAKLRMSVLHPAATPEFVKAIGMPRELAGKPEGGLELLAEAKVRAALPPMRFLDWLRAVRSLTPEMVELAAAYANERRADFNEFQWKAWEERHAMPEIPLPERGERRSLPPGFDPRRR